MSHCPHCRSEGQKNVLFKHIGDCLVTVWGNDGVQNKDLDFEVVVSGEVAGDVGVDVGNGVAIPINRLIALVNL